MSYGVAEVKERAICVIVYVLLRKGGAELSFRVITPNSPPHKDIIATYAPNNIKPYTKWS